jgi:hypothetical protein
MPLLIFVLGLGLVINSASGGPSLSLFGVDVVIQVVRGVGLIAILASAIAFSVAYGSTIPQSKTEHLLPSETLMGKAKILLGIVIFLTALSLLLFGPAQHEPALTFAGFVLLPRTATALSILFMVSGVLFTLRSVVEWKFE